MQFGSFSFSLLFDRLCDAQNAIRVKYQITLLNKSKWRPWETPNGSAGGICFDVNMTREISQHTFQRIIVKVDPRYLFYFCYNAETHSKKKKRVYVAQRGVGGGGLLQRKLFQFQPSHKSGGQKPPQKCSQSQVKCLTCVNDTHINACISLVCVRACILVCVSICT